MTGPHTHGGEKYERRAQRDRRFRATPPVSRFLFRGQRRQVRRATDRQQGYHFDRYSQRFFFLILLVVGLSIIDAGFTLYLVRHGAAELNPVMDYFLGRGPGIFLGMKYLLTTLSALLLLVNSHATLFRTRFRAKILFNIIILIFSAVVVWEIYLCLFVVPS